jgi:hypothetical protein
MLRLNLQWGWKICKPLSLHIYHKNYPLPNFFCIWNHTKIKTKTQIVPLSHSNKWIASSTRLKYQPRPEDENGTKQQTAKCVTHIQRKSMPNHFTTADPDLNLSKYKIPTPKVNCLNHKVGHIEQATLTHPGDGIWKWHIPISYKQSTHHK